MSASRRSSSRSATRLPSLVIPVLDERDGGSVGKKDSAACGEATPQAAGACYLSFDRAAQPLLVLLLLLLLPLRLDVELLLVAPELCRAFPLQLVPVNRQLVLDGDLVIHELAHGGERQSTVLQFQVLDLRLFLVGPGHRPGDFVPV